MSELQKGCNAAGQELFSAGLAAAMKKVGDLEGLSAAMGLRSKQFLAASGALNLNQITGQLDSLTKAFAPIEGLTRNGACVYSDLLGKTAGQALSKWSDSFRLSLPNLPALRFPAIEGLLGFRDLERNLPASFSLPRSHYMYHVLRVVDETMPEEERVESIRYLLKTTFKFPVAKQRWRMHGWRLTAAIRERALDLGTSQRKAWDSAAEAALFAVCAELKLPRERTCFVEDGKRHFVEDMIAWEDLGIPELRPYMQNRLSDEVMDTLVPHWRDFDTKDRIELSESIVSFEEAGAEHFPDKSFPEAQTDASLSVFSILACQELSEDQRMLLRLMVEEELSAAAAARQMGRSNSWGGVTLSRIRKKLKKSS